jgi:hypothetical protein
LTNLPPAVTNFPEINNPPPRPAQPGRSPFSALLSPRVL